VDHIPCELTGNRQEDDHNGGKGPDPGQEGRESMNYYVVAQKWNADRQQQVFEIVGTFKKFYLAKLFQEAYEAEFKSHPKIYDDDDLLN